MGKKVPPPPPPHEKEVWLLAPFSTHDLRIASGYIDFDGGGGGGTSPDPLVFSFSFEAIPTSVFQKTSDLKETRTAEY